MPQKTFIDDMLTLGSGVLSNLSEARHELKAQAKQRVGSVARDFDLVSRDEFDAAFAMLAKARNMQEELSARLARVEQHLNLSSGKTVVKKQKTNLPSVKALKTSGSKKARK
jgi:BMFP domain-containing protein YqiC